MSELKADYSVYILWRDELAVYVGQTYRPTDERAEEHRTGVTFSGHVIEPKDFTHYEVVWSDYCIPEDARDVEQYYIDFFGLENLEYNKVNASVNRPVDKFWDKERVTELGELVDAGWSNSKIAEHFKTTKAAAENAVSKYGFARETFEWSETFVLKLGDLINKG